MTDKMSDNKIVKDEWCTPDLTGDCDSDCEICLKNYIDRLKAEINIKDKSLREGKASVRKLLAALIEKDELIASLEAELKKKTDLLIKLGGIDNGEEHACYGCPSITLDNNLRMWCNNADDPCLPPAPPADPQKPKSTKAPKKVKE